VSDGALSADEIEALISGVDTSTLKPTWDTAAPNKSDTYAISAEWQSAIDDFNEGSRAVVYESESSKIARNEALNKMLERLSDLVIKQTKAFQQMIDSQARFEERLKDYDKQLERMKKQISYSELPD
jgi:hypothetical protein